MVTAIHVQDFLWLLSQQSKNNLKQDSDQPRNTAIPGYAGYIPGLIAENMHGRRYSAMARQSFENLGLATNKYNLDRTTMIDRDKIASTSKYGKSQIQRVHPSLNVYI